MRNVWGGCSTSLPHPLQIHRRIKEESLVAPNTLYPRVVKGGSWDDGATSHRSAVRMGSEEAWKQQDPQIPKSVWYHTDALFVGFRVVRPRKSRPWMMSRSFGHQKKTSSDSKPLNI